MATTLIQNIAQLAGIGNETSALRGSDLANLQSIKEAWLLIEDEEIADYGPMDILHQQIKYLPGNVINAAGRIVLPAWCDSHTHLVFAGSREDEFRDKIKGLSYAEIAARGGGILNSAKKLNETTEDQLFVQAMDRIRQAMQLGTANFEIKSGYGLTLESELKMLRVVKRLKNACRATIRSTFLGAHAYPAEFVNDHEGYVDLIVNEMLPAIAAEKLADYIDVFCEKGFFSVEEMRTICIAGLRYGLKPKIHANQLTATGAVEAAVELGSVSVDHLEVMNDSAIASLKNSQTIGTLLPSAAFFLQAPYQPARKLIDQGCAVALASDCNPGSSPGFNMNFILSLACVALKMLPEEAINAATFNGACALELQRETGSIWKGKKADLVITKPIPSLAYLPYSFSSVLVERTIVKGEFFC